MGFGLITDSTFVLEKNTLTMSFLRYRQMRILSHLNLVGPSIQFTFNLNVHQKERCLPLLDLNVHRTHRGNLEISICRKLLDTEKYLTFDSHWPPFCRKVPRLSRLQSMVSVFLPKIRHLTSHSSFPYALVGNIWPSGWTVSGWHSLCSQRKTGIRELWILLQGYYHQRFTHLLH